MRWSRSLLSSSTVRSARKMPRSDTRFFSCSAAVVRFSSARRLCQLPSAMPAAHAAAASASAQRRGRKEYPASMRYVVIGVFVLICASLASAGPFIFCDRRGPQGLGEGPPHPPRPFLRPVFLLDGRLLLR